VARLKLAFLFVLVVVVMTTGLSAEAAAEPSTSCGWMPPVDGRVVRGFDPPAARYGPGHLGVDLAAAPGTPVRAAGAGSVSFAGAVAGSLHVVVAHDGGLRTSYSFLARIDVRRGQSVAPGDVVGAAGGPHPDHAGVVHFGLRSGDEYLDPMLLIGECDLTKIVRLVPVEPVPSEPWTVGRERSGLLRTISGHTDGGGGGGGVGDFLQDVLGDAIGSGADALMGGADAALDGLGALGAEVWDRSALDEIADTFAEIADRIGDYRESQQECSDDSPPADGTGGSGHRLLAVAGINSSTGAGGATTDLDAEALGYYEDEVDYFSYAADGGAYDAEETWGDLHLAAERLGEQLRQMHVDEPGREVDLIAHSQGGVVVDAFLQHVYDAADPAYPPIGTVVTLASPHEGAPLASVAVALEGSHSGRALLDIAADASVPAGGSPSIEQLAVGSRFLDELWDERMPEHVQLTSIGGSDDVVVPGNRIEVPGGTDVVVDVGGVNDHSAIPTDPDALRVVRAALEGRAPPCMGAVEGIRGAVEPVVIDRIEGLVGDLAEVLP
jgi:hypothetical protein